MDWLDKATHGEIPTFMNNVFGTHVLTEIPKLVQKVPANVENFVHEMARPPVVLPPPKIPIKIPRNVNELAIMATQDAKELQKIINDPKFSMPPALPLPPPPLPPRVVVETPKGDLNGKPQTFPRSAQPEEGSRGNRAMLLVAAGVAGILLIIQMSRRSGQIF